MGKQEIERKFLVVGDGWPRDNGVDIEQGYLHSSESVTVRVRIADCVGWLTIKGRPSGPVRDEFEYQIPLEDAQALLELCGNRRVKKCRYRIAHGNFTWELDVFGGDNAGLVMAEIETDSEAALARAVAQRPAWAGRDVSEDSRFHNSSLAKTPFGTWPEAERQALAE